MLPWTIVGTVGYAASPTAEFVLETRHGRNIIGLRQHEQQIAWHWDHHQCYQAVDPYSKRTVPLIFSDQVQPNMGTGIMKLSPCMDYRSAKIIETAEGDAVLKRYYTAATALTPIVDNQHVIESLRDSGVLLSTETLSRSDSACPKCRGRLITYPAHGIFFKVDEHRAAISKSLDKIYWEPKDSKQRALNYLSTARNWLITRTTTEKSAGIPVPLWTAHSAADAITVLGSYRELEDSGLQMPPSSSNSNSTYQWVEMYFDNWFDSACMPYGSVRFPFKTTRMELLSSLFPCLLAVEGLDQIHGWFFTTNVISATLFGSPAFQNVITNGLVLDNGTKMSKSNGKVGALDPINAITKYGADSYRIYLMQNRLLSGVNFNYDQNKISAGGSFIRNLLAVHSGLHRYLSSRTVLSGLSITFRISRITNVTDNWILQSLDDYLTEYHQLMSTFKVARALSLAGGFVGKLRKYLHFNRERLLNEDTVAASVAVRVFYYFIQTTAPFAPFVSEYIYQQLRPYGNFVPLSVHHCHIPAKQWIVNSHFLEASDLMFRIIDLMHKCRSTAGATDHFQVYVYDTGLLRGIDTYISAALEGYKAGSSSSIEYRDDLSKVMRAWVEIKHTQIYSVSDRTQLESMSLIDIIQLDRRGYFCKEDGDKTYPGQYIIRYAPAAAATLNGTVQVGAGVLVHCRGSNDNHPDSEQLDSNDLIIRGQLIGKQIAKKLQEIGERCAVYISYPSLDGASGSHNKLKILLANINRYTLPIIGQRINQYHPFLGSAFAQLTISVYGCELVFYFYPVDLEDQQS